MPKTDSVFAGSIPEIYDTLLVPLLFQPYASDLARRAAERGPADVLETAAGSGAVTRALATLLSECARYVVTDLNQPMLDRAAQRQASDKRIVWRQADAAHLPFEDQSFDVVVCQFGAMFFPDRIACYGETRRVLKPGGRFLFNVWDRIESNDFARVATEAVSAMFPEDPPRFLARIPHGYHDVETIRSDAQAAGFSPVDITTIEAWSDAQTARDVAIAYCQGTPLRNEIEARDPAGIEAATERVAEAIQKVYGKGAVSGRICAHIIAAQA